MIAVMCRVGQLLRRGRKVFSVPSGVGDAKVTGEVTSSGALLPHQNIPLVVVGSATELRLASSYTLAAIAMIEHSTRGVDRLFILSNNF